MKHKSIIFGSLLILLSAFFACKQQDEMYSQYVVEGGRVYPHRAENAIAAPGVGCVDISWPNTTRTVTAACIYWNSGRDTSVCVDIAAQTDTVRRSIELPEGLYSFIIKTFDKDGNTSVPVEIIGRSLGDNYLSGMLDRMTTGYKTRGGAHLVIEWGAADISNGAVYCNVVYTATDNSEKTVRAPAGESSTTIEDHKPGTAFRYNTVYRPDPQYSVEIPTAYREITGVYLLLDNKGAEKVIDYSSQIDWWDACFARNMYNGIYIGDRWYAEAPYPHWVTIDMGAEESISRLGLAPARYDNHNVADTRVASRVEWLVSTDNQNWTSLGTFDYDRSSNNLNARLYDVTTTTARYVKLYMAEYGSSPQVDIITLGEVDVYTKMGE
ncbi:MAG: discoidin domain-containing protein [Prevotellaceae bacterium]|jgi:hypothetical protein|nr:discoidin domain-containing protein [Prevotellaceae bacterium]